MTPDDARRLLGRGVSLAGVFDGGPGEAPALTSPLRYVDLVHDAGFRTLRLPVRWSAHAADVAPYRIEPGFLAAVDRVVDHALALGLTVVVTQHHDHALTADPSAANRSRLLAWTARLASHFADHPDAALPRAAQRTA